MMNFFKVPVAFYEGYELRMLILNYIDAKIVATANPHRIRDI